MKKLEFKYKENYYIRKPTGEFSIRSHANVDGCGYSYFHVRDEKMQGILEDYVNTLNKE